MTYRQVEKHITCSRCNKHMTWSEWQEHICEDMPLLSDLDMDLLSAVIERTISETNAFEIQAGRKGITDTEYNQFAYGHK